MEIIGVVFIAALVIGLIARTIFAPVHGPDPFPDVTDFSQEDDMLLKWSRRKDK